MPDVHTPSSSSSSSHSPDLDQRVPVTFDRLIGIRTPIDPVLSPDGQCVAFVVLTRQPDQPNSNRRIWMVNTAGGEPKPFTRGTYDDWSPCWSPNSKHLAFISLDGKPDQDAQVSQISRPQLYIRDMENDHTRPVCKMPNGVSDPSWSPDGNRISFISLEGKKPSVDPIVVAPGHHHRLWTVHPDSDTPEPVTPDTITVWEYAWSPDSQYIALYYSTGPDDTDWYQGQIGIIPARGGAIRQITQLTRQASSLAWSPDGRRLAFISGSWSDPGQGGGDIYMIDVNGGQLRNLTPGIDASPGWCRWFPNGERILYAAWYGVTYQIGIINMRNGSITPIEEDFVIEPYASRLSPTPNLQHFVTVHSTPQQPPDVWLGDLSSEKQAKSVSWHRLSRLNPLAEETFALSPTRHIRYESVDGWQIDGIFMPPLNYKSDGPPPLYVDVHGGPSGAYLNGWAGYTQLIANAGYAVFKPNMRGSWGHGVSFADAVLGDMGGKDFQDILRGIDYLVEQGLVDGERVGIGGWSNGGFLTAWAITQTTRFKAAMMGAGISDWHNMHAQTNIANADILLLQADPLEKPEVYRLRSPITFANRATTPTLIIHGEKDPAVPVAQAYAFYRALAQRNVPVEFVVYPREGHGLRETEHLRDYYERLLRWLERYLKHPQG